jgi:hypothetical protein
VNRPLDRERIPQYKLTISVKDNPENPRIARRVRPEGTVGAGGSWEYREYTILPKGGRLRNLGISKCWVQILPLPIHRCMTLAK